MKTCPMPDDVCADCGYRCCEPPLEEEHEVPQQPHIVRGGPVRARDLRANIMEFGFEQGMVHTVERLLDEYAQTRQNLRELVSLVDKCIEEVSKMVQIGTAMRTQIEQLKRTREEGDMIDHEPH